MLMATKLEIQDVRRQNLRLWIEDKYEGSQARFVDATGINQGELSGLLKTKSFGEKKARKLESQAGMPDGYLDGETMDKADEPALINPIIDSDTDFVGIQRVDLKISAGVSGYAVDYLGGERDPIFFRRAWMLSNGYSPDKLFALEVKGESMVPSLWEGDIVVANAADTKPIDTEVYAVNYEGELVIKRLVRESGTWWLSSDNMDKRRFPNKLCHEQCFIIGKVVYKQSEKI